MNNNFAEYISCKIFESVEIPVQKTDLSVLNINGENKIVCVCEDFTDKETTLIEYCNSENDKVQEIFEEKNKKSYQLDIDNIIESINNNNKITNKNEILDSFWNMFIIDAFLYNKDRHNENWGFLENNKTGVIKFAPVYDCSSSLFALYSEEKCKSILDSHTELKNLAINSISAMTYNNKKIRYFEFLSSFRNNDCTKALKRIYPKIDLCKINEIIDNTPFLTNQYKIFYKEVIKTSYELVLTPIYKKARNTLITNTTTHETRDDK